MEVENGMLNQSKKGKLSKMELKDLIIPTFLDNTDQYGNFGNKNFRTRDMVYLPAANEVNQEEPNMIVPTDYAIMNGALRFTGTESVLDQIKGADYCRLWLRSGYTGQNKKISILNNEGRVYCVDAWETKLPHSINPCIELAINAVLLLKELKSDVIRFKHFDKYSNYCTVEFGEYPTSLVKCEEAEKLEAEFQKGILGNLLKISNKEYTGGYDARLQFYKKYSEFLFKNIDQEYYRKFVRCITNDGNFNWFEVKPISWDIKNWDKLPTSINPKGTGEARTIKLQTENAILSGICFYPNKNDENSNLWQNSSIRGYLNGYNVNNITGNGNLDYTAPNGGNFTQNNFINEAFSYVKLKINEIDLNNHILNGKKERQGWGVEIREKPMTINEQIKFYIESGKTFMLHGLSGVGKSRRIEEIDPDFTSIVLRNGMLPEEVIGKTIYPNNDKTQAGIWVPPLWYHNLCEKCNQEPNQKHVLFIDEITNVKESVQSIVYDLILNRTICPNRGKLPNNAVVVAAGNNTKESASAFNMSEPLFRRFVGHVEIPLDIPQWLEWGSEIDPENGHSKVHPLIASFVGTYGEKVFYSHYDPENPPKTAIDPRGWEQVSDILYANHGVLAKELIENKAGKEITASLIEFAQIAPITVEDIIEENYDYAEIPTKFDAKYALALSLRFAKPEQLNVVRNFISANLGGEILKMFDMVWVGKDNEKALFLAGLMNGSTTQQNQGWEK